MFESTDVNVFGVVARGSFESTVVSGYFGCGSADAFLRKHFKVGVQEMVDLWEAYVCSNEASTLATHNSLRSSLTLIHISG